MVNWEMVASLYCLTSSLAIGAACALTAKSVSASMPL